MFQYILEIIYLDIVEIKDLKNILMNIKKL